ncbi:hypothetical protein M9H77_28560 [Catharanthus roseus]|uniref:Uncharacterized protein n=1 Tax=Catharanthus roseus TaxID=4058 RepID=A0ACC0AH38_CATRO|nr:hypothetical protein M9H77_28560 [Catharanthus roseus]
MSNDIIGNVNNDMVEESHAHRIKKDAYYVSSADGPGLVLTTVQLKETEKDNNYAEWARAMRMALRLKKNDDPAFAVARAAAKAAAAAGRDCRIFPSKFYCTYCKQAGHDVTGCFQLVGYPEWWRSRPLTGKQ